MISEVVNALFLTYLATEYTLSTNNNNNNASLSSIRKHSNGKSRWRSNTTVITVSLSVAVINLLDQITGAAAVLHSGLQGFLHLPKILFAAIIYVLALFIDCRQLCHGELLFFKMFLPMVSRAFVRVLPVYPFLAVLISFGFLFVINLFEFLHLPEEWLNLPIYYGTLYGPFSFVYWKVKEKVIHDRNSLPVSSST